MVGEKRPATIIGKYEKPRCFKNKILSNIKYYANKNAWMTSDLFKHELFGACSEFGHPPKGDPLKNGINIKI
ncbi:hypothetical protein ENBRE01_2960 [Enteropsectra breve]|nr:hypothetical protein ENBRE01_2960 [Enteropsectra breve]